MSLRCNENSKYIPHDISYTRKPLPKTPSSGRARTDTKMIVMEKKFKRQKKIAQIKRIIGYIFVLGVVAACNYTGIVVAANTSEESVTRDWTKSFLISLAQDMVSTQVVKVVVTVVLMKMISRGVSKQKLRIYRKVLDDLTTRALVMKNAIIAQKKPQYVRNC